MLPAIQIKNLIKRYRKADKNAVDDISLSVAEGEFFALLGPNGAGKTTTVSILTTTLAKTSGSVRIAGFDLDTNEREIRQRVGVIFQGPSIDLNLTAEENIRFHAMLYGIYPFRPFYSLMPKEYRQRVMDLSRLLDIEDAVFKPIRTFSGGMKRKLEIVRSLIHKPKVLFLDEPTTGLDPLSRRTLWKYLERVRKEEKTTVFLTTHYLEEAEVADHVGIVNNGKIVMYGSPKEIKQQLVHNELIIDAENRDHLRRELRNVMEDIKGDGPFRVALGTPHHAQQIIRSLQTPLTLLDMKRPTLEDAYLAIIDHGDSTEQSSQKESV